MAEPERLLQIKDVEVLAAMAHPLRVALLNQLAALGPRTASECAAALGETPSNCSYHLRQLQRFGLVARAEPSNGRERPWRAAWTGLRTSPELDGPQAGAAERATRDALAELGIEYHAQLARQYLRLEAVAAPEWREAATAHDYSLRCTPQELRDLVETIDRTIRPYIGLTREDPPPGAQPVHLDFRAFLRPEVLA